MKIVERFPHNVREIENAFIPLRDGMRLAARIWLPTDAEQSPVPAILEYIPYRKRDGHVDRDALTHPWFAGHGYACVRVDIRGTGDSDGIFNDEYTDHEQDDCIDVISWIAAQPWCAGPVGMMGISYGGCNALQVAAKRPSALKTIITICAADDLYADDAHYMGGCLLTENLGYASILFGFMTRPPDPEIVGDRWREMWLDRLQNHPLFVEEWLHHPLRDAYWKRASVCEDYSAIQCPVYAIGGFADGYSNAVFKLMAGLKVPRKGLLGPWAHKYPHIARPGPQIGFLQEALRWWDHWLKGKNNDVMHGPTLRVWMQESTLPSSYYQVRPGRWIGEEVWPSPTIRPKILILNTHSLDEVAGEERSLLIDSPQDHGARSGAWSSYGLAPDLSNDQRADDGMALVFDSSPLTERLEILGFPSVVVDITSDRPQALLAVRLCDVAPDGTSERVTYGVLNLTHRDSHETSTPLTPHKRYRVQVDLKGIAHAFPATHRIRVAIATTLWPLVWPSPLPARLQIFTGTSFITLPTRAPQNEDERLPHFEESEGASPVVRTTLRPSKHERRTERDHATGETTFQLYEDFGAYRLDLLRLDTSMVQREITRVQPNDPNTMCMETAYSISVGRSDWKTRTETRTVMRSTVDTFQIDASLDAYEGDQHIMSRNWSKCIPREGV